MNELLQSAQHPDAEQLAAFAEECLPAHEREQMLAHLATCAGCREVVFLAQEGLPEETPAVHPVAKAGWFSGWNLVWPAAVALAGIVAGSVHLRSVAKDRPQASRDAVATTEAPPPVTVPAPAAAEAPRAAAPMPPRESLEALRKAAPVVSPPKSAVAGLAAPPPAPKLLLGGPAGGNAGVTNGSGYMVRPAGTLGQASKIVPLNPLDSTSVNAVRAKDFPGAVALGRSAAAPTPATGVSPAAAAKPPAMQAPVQAAAPPPPAYANQSVTVEAAAPLQQDAAAQIAAGASVPQGAKQKVPAAAPKFDQSFANGAVLNNRMVTNANGAAMPTPALPSHLPALASAIAAGRMLTLDVAGGLFVSKDHGQHWKAVKPQWSGRAIRVENAAAATPFGSVGGKPPAFLLTNDKGSSWTSPDGVKWTAMP